MTTDQNAIRTSTLLRRLFKAPNLETFMKKNMQEVTMPLFSEYIIALSKKQGEVPERIINRAGIERSFGHQLFKGSKNPSRDTVIQLAFGFQMNVDDTQYLLQIAQKSILYPKFDRDAAILYCINKGLSFIETQNVLHGIGATVLGGKKKND